ncbi:sensor histidine kinase [Oleispirillum naphthae]|uniref:sensor histidine kinase n=1 Tax=Oleispirillum naphthae TaxID=2838853 RepID=UPI00308258E3
MRGAHAPGGPDQAADLGDPLEHYPLPALRAGSDGGILYANRAARRLAARLADGLSALLPEYHGKYLAAALAAPGETVTACARFYDAATVLQWSYALAPDGHGVSMFAADVGGYALLSGSIADPMAKGAPSAYDSLLRRFVEHVPVAAAMFDRDMRYLLASRRWRSDFGFLPERLEGRCHYDLVDVPPDWKERHRRALAGEDMPPVEIFFTRPDTGRVEWMITQSLPWTREDGEIGGILIFAQIITARKEAEAAAESRQASLQHQQKMEALGTLAGGIAHEINSPIQYISDNLGFLSGAVGDLSGLVALYREALAAAGPPPETRQRIAGAEAAIDLPFLASESGEAVAQALSGVRAISRIVTAIKTFSHPGHADPMPVDINGVIRDAVVVSRNQWKPVAEVEEDLDETMPLILGHGDQLGQVVLNLIVNAMHAIEDADRAGRGRIRLSSRACGDHAEIRIEDNGSGIPAHLIGRIFEPFFTTKAPGRGTGQGLSIVHAIVARGHGGEVKVESDPGHFTRFTVSLPYRLTATDR